MRPEETSSPSSDLRCVLCKRAEENTTTGPLSRKQDIAAHQNCLLYASGIYCKNSPAFDDLFGFTVEDVESECRRGRKLKCAHCKQTGATAGCEVRSCKRSYHFPCAKEARAKADEDEGKGIYTLYCEKHDPNAGNVGSEEEVTPRPGRKKSETNDKDNSHEGSESDSETSFRRSSQKKKRKLQEFSSDSDETQTIDLTFAPLESEPEDAPPKQNTQQTSERDPEDRSRDNKKPRQEVTTAPNGGDEDEDEDEAYRDSDIDSQSLLETEYRHENVPFTVIADSGPSAESVAENSPDPFSPGAPSPGDAALSNLDQSASAAEQKGTLHSNVTVPPNPPYHGSPPSGTTGESSSAKETSCGDLPEEVVRCASRDLPPLLMKTEPPGPHDDPLDLTAAPGGCCVPHVQYGNPVGHGSVPETHAALFWRRCNDMGCTEAIFTELNRQLASLAEKVQNQHATRQDYAVSLRILEASGKLPAIFSQMEQDLENQERQLQRKKEALKDAKAVLKESQFM